MMVENILSVDVEEIFHIEYARHRDRVNLDFRTPKNIRSILDFLMIGMLLQPSSSLER